MNATLAPRPVLAPSVVRLPLASAEARLPWTSTPRRLQLLGAIVLLAALLLALAAQHAASSARGALTTIGRDSAPSIVAAMRLRTAVADLDANLLNLLLTAPGSRDREVATQAAARRRAEIADTLVRAAENVTFGQDERVPLARLVRDLPVYEAAMSRALVLEEKGDHNGALLAARHAGDLARHSLLAAADALETANHNALDAAWERTTGSVELARGGLLGALLLATGALAALQGFLIWRTRRRVNAGLLAATAVALGFGFVAVLGVSSAHARLREAKRDSFESIALLWQARTLANDANGLESRALLEASSAGAHAHAFTEVVERILRPPGGDWTRVAADLRHYTLASGYEGLLVRALQNITYAGEREAVVQSMATLEQYVRVDTRVRDLQARGEQAAAVALCLSYAADGSNGAFDRFEAALERALAVNQAAFDQQIALGLDAVSGLGWKSLAAALLIAGATLAGLRPRLREYAA